MSLNFSISATLETLVLGNTFSSLDLKLRRLACESLPLRFDSSNSFLETAVIFVELLNYNLILVACTCIVRNVVIHDKPTYTQKFQYIKLK